MDGSGAEFDEKFAHLTGNAPFPWQRALYERFLNLDFPNACDLPTGMGKTSVIAIWLLALAKNPRLPRRLVYVVNRRTVVDQSTAEAENILKVLSKPELADVREALLGLAAVTDEAPLAISSLRGELAENPAWRRDPSRPAVIVGTVDMIGSRLLFNGYGCGFKSKPLHAGFLGHDALLVHDEAHLEPAFQSLLISLAEAQTQESRRLRVLALSATGRELPDFTLSPADEAHPMVRARLSARKGIALHEVADRKELADRIARLALERSGAVLIFLSTVEGVERCAAALVKEVGKQQVQVLTGTMRGEERDALTISDPVFARFQPPKSRKVPTREGTVFLLCTSAGEVGIDISADHLISDLPPFDSLAQRLGRVNRYGEGDALIELVCEPLKAPPVEKTGGETDEGDEDEPGKPSDEYEWARHRARELLRLLPTRPDGRYDGSPGVLRGLPLEARREASSPVPEVCAVDELLFDRWSYTTIREKLPGRPPVADWLHGVAEWEPPRTTVAWRREVAWLEEEQLAGGSFDDLLDEYPLRPRERLNDRSDRVLKHLEKMVARDKPRALRAWLVRDGAVVRCGELGWWPLNELVGNHDPKRNPLLHEATVILSPEAGGLRSGLLDGEVTYDVTAPYDVGPRKGERLVHESADTVDAPDGMRLVRAIDRTTDEGEASWWQLYTRSMAAEDDGSRSSSFEQSLEFHLRRAAHWAREITTRLGVAEPERTAIVRAAHWHDLGKNRRVWQRSIKNTEYPQKVYAKRFARGKLQPLELGSYRHELGSLSDAAAQEAFGELSEHQRDLALHLIAAHHGRARPYFPVPEAIDPELKDEVVAALVREVPRRFDRLQRRYGRWGLAWLESLVRAADYLASDEEEVGS